MAKTNLPGNLLDRVKGIERDIKKMRAMLGLASAVIARGGLTLVQDAFIKMLDDMGIKVLYVGPDANGRQVFELSREGGSAVLRTFFTANGQAWASLDKANRVIVADDADTGGLARPWLSVPMTPLFTMGSSTIYGYGNVAASDLASETKLWSGRIPLSLHPRINIAGVWGQASGSNSATYRLKVGGIVVGEWTTGASLENSTKGPFDIFPWIELGNVAVELTVTATGSGQVATQVYGCWTRQT